MHERFTHRLTSDQRLFLEKNTPDTLRKKPFQEFPSYPLARERIERMCLIRGVGELYHFLKRIETKEGQLPGILLFPDTGARPLPYLIKPLLKQLYEDHDLPFPKQAFVATHRFDETGQFFAREEEGLRITSNNRAIHTLYNERDRLIRTFKHLPKRTSQTVIDEVSASIESLGARIEALRAQNLRAREDLAWLEQRGWKTTVSERIRDAVEQAPNQPILVIDDFLSAGDTLRAFTEARDRFFPQQPLYFFSFLAFASSFSASDASVLERSHYANGFDLGGRKMEFLKTAPEPSPEFFTNPEVFAEEEPRLCHRAAWRDIAFESFSKIRSHLGYEKSPLSRSKYSSQVLPQDIPGMRALRERYTAIGKNALLFVK